MEFLLADNEIISKISRKNFAKVLEGQAGKTGKYLLYDHTNEQPIYTVEEQAVWKTEIDKMVNANPGTDERKYMIELIQAYSAVMLAEKNPAANISDLRNLEEKIDVLMNSYKLPSEGDTKPMQELLEQFGKLKSDIGAKPCKIDKVDKNIGPFWGNPHDKIEDWLYVIHSWQKLHSVPNDKMIPLLTPLIRGNALQLLKTFEKETFGRGTWTEFEKQLKSLYDPEHKKRLLRQELRSLRHTGSSFTEFTHKFQSIAAQLTMQQDELIDLFTDALMPKSKLHVIELKPKTLTEAISAATRFEDCCGSNSQQRQPANINQTNTIKKVYYAKSNFPRKPRYNSFKDGNEKYGKRPFQKSLSNNGMYAGKTTYQRTNGSRPAVDKTRMKCYNCQKEGHISKDCRAPRKVVHKANQVVETTQARKFGNHDEIVFQASSGENSILSTDALVNGNAVQVSFDSGATASIISSEVIKRYEMKTIPSDIKVKTADNSVINIIGVTEQVTIEVHGHICKLSLLIMDHEDHDVLLGLNWFAATGAGLFPAEKILKFPGQKVHLGMEGKWIQDELSSMIVDQQDEVLVSEVIDSYDLTEESYWEPMTAQEIKELAITPGAAITESQRKLFTNTINNLKPLFAVSVADLKSCNIGKHVIRTKDVNPIYSPPYRKSQAERLILKQEVSEMLKHGIIEQSNSEWSSPCLLVPKKDGTKRFCVDYRKLNAVTNTEQWPIPRIQDILDRMGGSKLFTAWDLTSGYWQIEMDENSKNKTAFSTPDGHYQFRRMPFGLKNAPAEFSRIMHRILGNRDYVEIYLDDITIHSKSFEEHIEHIKLVATELIRAGLKVKPSKCTWIVTQVTILGHVVSGGQVAMDPKKVEALKTRVAPKTVKQVQQFLGICNYYRKFVKGYAQIAAPIFNLLKSDVKFEWNPLHQKAFDDLINALTSYPVLRQPDFQKPFQVYTDASGFALGAVLSQRDDNNNEYACAFASRILKGAELHYGITEKECLAVVFAVKQFRIYLYGTQFQVITDHSALAWLMNINDPTGRLARWAIYLQAYEFEIVHRRGVIHSNADALSRPVLILTRAMKQIDQEDDITTKNLDPYDDETLLYYLKFKKYMSGVSKKQKKRVEALSDYYSLDENEQLWYAKTSNDKQKKVPRPQDRIELATKAHLLGHFQVESTLNRLKEEYHWKNMLRDVEKVVAQCEACRKEHRVVPMEHPAKALKVNGIFDRIGMDLTFGLPTTQEGYNGLLVITEYLTKYPYAVPIKSKTAEEIAEKLLVYISLFGPPKTILSDQGTEFNNAVVDRLIKATGVEKRITSAYHPRTNGLTERFNYTFVEALRKFTSEDNENWPKWVPFVLMAFRSRTHSTTGFTPFELMFGRKMNSFSDWRDEDEAISEHSVQLRAEEIKRMIETHHATAKNNIEKRQVHQKASQNTQHRITMDVVPIGTKVYISTTGMHNKLYPKYRGPFTVVEYTEGGNYIVENKLKERLEDSFPLQRLKIVNDFEKEQETSDNFVRVEKIVDSRPIGNSEYEYLVKYEGYPESENEWVRKEDFTDTDMLNSYWMKEKGLTEKKKRGRPRKIRPSNLIYASLILFLLVKGIAGIVIKDDFYMCSGNHDTLWSTPFVNVEESCGHLKQNQLGRSQWLTPNTDYLSVHVLTKPAHEVHRTGYECHKNMIVTTTYENFFGAKETTVRSNIIELSRDACYRMVEESTCEGFKMTCDDITCIFTPNSTIEHNWMTTNTKTEYTCVVTKRPIIAQNVNSKIFGLDCTVNVELLTHPLLRVG